MADKRKSRTTNFIGTALCTIVYQVTLIVTGFIVPRLIIGHYGSDVNGLVNSLTQFINYFMIVEAGIAGAAEVMLYTPLAKDSWDEVSRIVSAAKNYYIKVGCIFVGLVSGLALVYPFLGGVGFLSAYEVAILVFLLGAKGFIDFFTLSKYRVLLTADRRTWVIQLASALYQVLNVAIIVCLIQLDASIIVVYSVSLVAVLIRTVILVVYTRFRYKQVDYAADCKDVVLSQHWDVLFQQILGVVQQGVPIIAATFVLGDYKLVSVFSVYFLIANGVQQIPSFLGSGLQASFGEMIAKGMHKAMRKSYAEYETMVYMVTVIACSCSFVLIIPFVVLYTEGVNDQNYVYPLVGFLCILNVALYHAKSPHGLLVIAVGAYRDTRWRALTQASILIIATFVLGWFFGMPGIFAGMCLSNLYRTIDLLIYTPRHLTQTPVNQSIRRFIVNAFALTISSALLFLLPIQVLSWGDWLLWSLPCIALSSAVTLIFNAVGNRVETGGLFARLARR